MEITIVTIEVMNRIPDWQKRVAGHAQSETSLAIDGGKGGVGLPVGTGSDALEGSMMGCCRLPDRLHL